MKSITTCLSKLLRLWPTWSYDFPCTLQGILSGMKDVWWYVCSQYTPLHYSFALILTLYLACTLTACQIWLLVANSLLAISWQSRWRNFLQPDFFKALHREYRAKKRRCQISLSNSLNYFSCLNLSKWLSCHSTTLPILKDSRKITSLDIIDFLFTSS